MAFTPIKKNSIKETIKNYLLNGYIIRDDGRDETPLEVIDRKYIKQMPSASNIGQAYCEIVENIRCSHSNLYEVLHELKEEYSLRRVSCACSGCCQYATYANYIDGE